MSFIIELLGWYKTAFTIMGFAFGPLMGLSLIPVFFGEQTEIVIIPLILGWIIFSMFFLIKKLPSLEQEEEKMT